MTQDMPAPPLLAPREPRSGPVTIGMIRDEHLALMQQWRSLPDDAVREARAGAFREAVAACGTDLESPGERDEAQGIIDYWASAISGLKGAVYPKLLVVADYSGLRAAAAAQSIRQVYEALDPPEMKPIARKVMENLLVLKDSTVERRRAQDREALRRSAGVGEQAEDKAAFDALLAKLVATGSIVRRAGETPDDDRFEVADVHVADQKNWPDLARWLKDAAAYNTERDRLVQFAIGWWQSGREPALLLSTPQAAHDALRFMGEDETLDAYIKESERTFWQKRRNILTIALAVVVVQAAALVGLWFMYDKANDRLEVAKTEIARAARQSAKAAIDEHRAAETTQTAEYLNTVLLGNSEAELKQIATATADAPKPEDDLLGKLAIVNGAVLLGTDKGMLVSDLKGSPIPGLGGLAEGSRLRMRGASALFTEMPAGKNKYNPPDAKATIPTGGQIVLQAVPRIVTLAGSRFFWAPVRVIPQVYVQYHSLPKAQVDAIRRSLAEAGFETPAAQLITGFSGLSEVRYQRPEDREVAVMLQDKLGQLADIHAAGAITCQKIAPATTAPVNFKLEFWFDPPLRSERRDPTCR
ncbi:hypothetical protein [Novosphingobium sp. NDB2Meth1]|uniref:nSTAND1 domain-containing NTPase n=1 Tax=Novosphingobium sp. NDB2Meth1 TaxID=1892847 RepID=UPI000930B267|nr:hypothetical protein [Novosphingobium sp. NDB2Meth1]